MTDLAQLRRFIEQNGPALGAVVDDYVRASLDGLGFVEDAVRAEALNVALAEALAAGISNSSLPTGGCNSAAFKAAMG